MGYSSNKGPSDDSIRQFHDTYDDKKRYDKKEKRNRKREKQNLKNTIIEALEEQRLMEELEAEEGWDREDDNS